MTQNILVLPGDGIGPEVSAAARLCLDAVAAAEGLDLSFDEAAFGGHGIDECGEPLPGETLKKAQNSDAIFLGAVGGPKWDKAPKRPEQGLLGIRKTLGLFANLRPIKVFEGLKHLSPLKADRVTGADVLIVRELTGGLYFGEKREGDIEAFDGCSYSSQEVDRIAQIAFKAAQGRSGRVMSVDKANVLATSRLWRKTVENVASGYPDVELDHMLVDAAAMRLVTHPASFDVIVTENLFGDILSDEASVISGSIGLQGSASMGSSGPGLFEPIHGSAPDIAGQNIANPAGAIASAAMMLRHGLGQAKAADRMDAALEAELKTGNATSDLGGTAKCDEFAAKIAERIAA
jgi:3-isopropylmalate dehydrogenase